jgi:hypothetical protein
MKKYVITTLDKNYCRKWISSWLGSLKEFADHQGEILIINWGNIPRHVVRRLQAHGCTVEYGEPFYKYPPLDRFLSIAEVARKRPGIFLYWEADVSFHGPVAPAFDLATEKLVACLDEPVSAFNTNFYHLRDVLPDYTACHELLNRVIATHGRLLHTGFVGGPTEMWDAFGNFLRFAVSAGVRKYEGADTFILNAFAACHQNQFSVADSMWNFLDPGHLGNQPVIHLAGTTKYTADTRSLLFRHRYPGLYRKWYDDLINRNSFFPETIVAKCGGKRLFFPAR